MISAETSLTLMAICPLILLLLGVTIVTWGKHLPGKGRWLVWAGLLVLFAGVGLDSGLFLNEEFKIKTWSSGWILSQSEFGAITVGFFQDSLSMAMSALVAIVAGVVILDGVVFSREVHSEKIYAALVISTAGVVVAWNSLTPWLALGGLVLTIFGGFISLGSRWDSDPEADLAARFVCERATGFLLSFFGACILAVSRSALLLNDSSSWVVKSENQSSTWMGSCFLVLGFFVQLQPFPFLGWMVSKSKINPVIKILLNQIFPAWAAYPLLLRLEPYLVSLGLFPALGWIALCSAILSIIVGLFQNQWRQGLGIWLASGLSLSVALLAFSGPLAALALLLGVSFGSLALSSAATALEVDCDKNITHRKRALWLKAVVFLGAAAGTGFVGFVSATGSVRWIAQILAFPGVVAFFLLNVFLFALLGWKLAWNIVRLQNASSASWLTVFSSFIWIVLSLGVVWTGTITGDVGLGGADRLMPSLLDRFFGVSSSGIQNQVDFVSASGLYWGILAVSIAVAFWTAGRKEDQWMVLAEFIPRTSRFISSGYGVDKVLEKIISGISWFGRSTEKLVDRKLWMNWIPEGLFYGVSKASTLANAIDDKISFFVSSTLRRLVEVPAKTLQLIQTGDLRWYLFFALSSGFALLSHFLKM